MKKKDANAPPAFPFSPSVTMEKMVNKDKEILDFDKDIPLESMMTGAEFTLYRLPATATAATAASVPVERVRIFMYYRRDVQFGTFYFRELSSSAAAAPLPARSEPARAGDHILPLSALTDIWLGKQTDTLMHADVAAAEIERCLSIFYTSSENPVCLDLEAESEELLALWLIGIHYVMNNGGRQLTKKDIEEQAAAAAAADAAAASSSSTAAAEPAPVSTVPVSAAPHDNIDLASAKVQKPKKWLQQRRFSIQDYAPRSAIAAGGIAAASPYRAPLVAAPLGGGAVDSAVAGAVTAKLSQLKTALQSTVAPAVHAVAAAQAAHAQETRAAVAAMRSEMHTALSSVLAAAKAEKQQQDATQTALIVALEKERAERKVLLNQMIEEHGNIRVFARVRPLLPFEAGNESCVSVTDDVTDDAMTGNGNSKHGGAGKSVLAAIAGDQEGVVEVAAAGANKPGGAFIFDKVFGARAAQETVAEEIVPFVHSCVDGYNVCIFAYGQTGSGKTYTMEGTRERPGVNYRALGELFSRTAALQQQHQQTGGVGGLTFSIEVSVVEIYNEQLRDLLARDQAANKLKIVHDQTAGVYVAGLARVPVHSVDQVRSLLEKEAYPNRAVGTTNMNAQSSRSHCVLFVHLDQCNEATGAKTSGKLVLIDLAGSERIDKSGATGQALAEAQNINQSLSALGNVIQALQSKNKHIPYRDSKLTDMLSDCLGGNAKCLMFCNVNPAMSNQNETMCSLRFAMRARNTALGKAQKNVKPGVSAAASAAQIAAQVELKKMQTAFAELSEAAKLKDKKIAQLELSSASASSSASANAAAAAASRQIAELTAKLDAQSKELARLRSAPTVAATAAPAPLSLARSSAAGAFGRVARLDMASVIDADLGAGPSTPRSRASVSRSSSGAVQRKRRSSDMAGSFGDDGASENSAPVRGSVALGGAAKKSTFAATRTASARSSVAGAGAAGLPLGARAAAAAGAGVTGTPNRTRAAGVVLGAARGAVGNGVAAGAAAGAAGTRTPVRRAATFRI